MLETIRQPVKEQIVTFALHGDSERRRLCPDTHLYGVVKQLLARSAVKNCRLVHEKTDETGETFETGANAIDSVS